MQNFIQLVSNGQRQSSSSSSSSSSPADVITYTRGIFRITVPPQSQDSAMIPRPRMRFIMYASIDASGSMGETASATRRGQNTQTKMQFVHMTMINMVEYIVSQEEENPHAEFYLSIVSFDSRASCVLPPCRVSKENKNHIIDTIGKIAPRGGTNFEKCFKEIANIMSRENSFIEDREGVSIDETHTTRMHVFLTDGVNNEGEKNAQRLAAILKQNAADVTTIEAPRKDTMQIMVGYGCDHDSTMLQNLCTQFPKSKQWFIDDVEKTGCVFGEILWCAMNTAYSDVRLSSNVEVFDFNKMSWEREIAMDDVVYDSSRTLYLRVPPEVPHISCELRYFSIENPSNTSTVETLEITPVSSESSTINEDVEKELWRLDTIMTVDKALKFLQHFRRLTYDESRIQKERMIQEVTGFQEKFLKYVSEKNLVDDPFIIQLADDLYVCINGLMATSIGELYVAARQTSQIQQRAVTVNDITPLQVDVISSMPPPPSLTDYPMHDHVANDYENDVDEEVPAAPIRTYSAINRCVDNDTLPLQTTLLAPTTPTTPTRQETPNSQPKDEAAPLLSEEDEKIVTDFTPSARGVGSKLRHLSKEAILGYRRPRISHYRGGYANEDEYYSCGGGNVDDVYSSHASPACARIGRMLSAPSQYHNGKVDRVSTCPY
jgi:hypothetical protein